MREVADRSAGPSGLPRDIVAAPEGAAGRLILLRGGTIVSMDPMVGNLATGDILIKGSKIVEIALEIADGDAEVIDASAAIVIPGFVDAHRHAWEGQLRRINPNSPTLEDYCNATHFSFATAYRPRDNYVGNLITALGCIDAGITTIVDNSHNARSGAHSDAAIEALLDAGIRAVHAPGAPLTGEWEEANWPRDLERLQARYFGAPDALVTLAMMSQLDRGAWAFARRLGLRIVTEFFGQDMASQLDALHREGLLGPDNIFNHCTGVPPEAWEIIRDAGVNVNVCPRSDAHYALEDGINAYQIALDHGVSPGLSVDNESSYGGDMFGEMRLAFYLQRTFAHGRRRLGEDAPPPVLVHKLLEAATIDGAACAGLADRVGSLTVGKEADIVLIRTDDINLYPSNNALGTVVHAAERGNVDTVMIGGRIRKRGGEVVGLDMAKLKAATEESREHLFSATGYEPAMFSDAFAPLHHDRTAVQRTGMRE